MEDEEDARIRREQRKRAKWKRMQREGLEIAYHEVSSEISSEDYYWKTLTSSLLKQLEQTIDWSSILIDVICTNASSWKEVLLVSSLLETFFNLIPSIKEDITQ